jgi:photosystem II stability/assembly factor-like uncharacterized protein
MRAVVGTADGVYLIDLEDETILAHDPDDEVPAPAAVELSLPRVVAAAAAGSTVVALVDRRPPLLVSHDAGRTWREAGGGLPRGRAVAIADDDPDLVLYAARNRLYLSQDGGRFWRAVGVELPAIERIALD